MPSSAIVSRPRISPPSGANGTSQLICDCPCVQAVSPRAKALHVGQGRSPRPKRAKKHHNPLVGCCVSCASLAGGTSVARGEALREGTVLRGSMTGRPEVTRLGFGSGVGARSAFGCGACRPRALGRPLAGCGSFLVAKTHGLENNDPPERHLRQGRSADRQGQIWRRRQGIREGRHQPPLFAGSPTSHRHGGLRLLQGRQI